MVEWKKLEDVFEIRNGYTPSKNNPEYWENGTIPWFRMEDIRLNGGILSDSIQHITPESIKKSGLFPANTIIVATTATIGEHALVIVDSLANQQFTAMTRRKSLMQSVLPRFAYYYCFKLDEWCKANIRKGGFASVDMFGFKNFPFPILSIAEQQRIVGILDTFTASIDNLKEQIAQRRKQYEYYRDQFLDLEGNPGVEMKTLGDICEISRGVRVVKRDLEESGIIPVFQNSLLPLGYYARSNNNGNTFVIIGGAAGDIGYSEKPFWAADDCLCISGKEVLVDKFIYNFLIRDQHYLKSQVRKAGVPRLSRGVLDKLCIPVPSLSEQQRIVGILDTFEATIQNLEAQLKEREKQYEYYRNKLLTFE